MMNGIARSTVAAPRSPEKPAASSSARAGASPQSTSPQGRVTRDQVELLGNFAQRHDRYGAAAKIQLDEMQKTQKRIEHLKQEYGKASSVAEKTRIAKSIVALKKHREAAEGIAKKFAALRVQARKTSDAILANPEASGKPSAARRLSY